MLSARRSRVATRRCVMTVAAARFYAALSSLFCRNLLAFTRTPPSVYWALITATPIGATAPVQEDMTTGASSEDGV